MKIAVAIILGVFYIYCGVEYCKARYADYIEELENTD